MDPFTSILSRISGLGKKFFYEDVATFEERQKIAEDEAKKWNNRVEMRLKEFKEVEIRHAMIGIEVTITHSHIA